ncbi:hypothetical protein ACFW1M_28215 [Streptomyces inhibens]|uniref:hypothetical protein n=1 Tax=Streptomyces inhibens TaxID=2293571 RepID=UPI00368A1AD0
MPCSSLFGGRRCFEQRLAQAQEWFRETEDRHSRAEAEHRTKLEQKKAEHRAAQEQEAHAVCEFNEALEQRRATYRAGEPASVEWFLGQTLDASKYPQGFPSRHRVAFRPADGSTLVEIQLPSEDIVPAVDNVVLNGHVTTVDRATGQEVSPCLITLSTDREQFAKLSGRLRKSFGG